MKEMVNKIFKYGDLTVAALSQKSQRTQSSEGKMYLRLFYVILIASTLTILIAII